MGKRLELHNKLVKYVPNVYYQPPSNIRIVYPCIVYAKSDKQIRYGNDSLYLTKQEYSLTLIEREPDTGVADIIEATMPYCSIGQYYITDNLNHTTLKLYY